MTSFKGEGSRVLTGLMVEKEMVNGKYKNDLEKNYYCIIGKALRQLFYITKYTMGPFGPLDTKSKKS